MTARRRCPQCAGALGGPGRATVCDVCGAQRCDVCGIWTYSPHEPHDPGCPPTGDCDCDNVTCPGHCWDCEGATA